MDSWLEDKRSRANKDLRFLLDAADFDPRVQSVTLNFCVSVNINSADYDELFEVAESAQRTYQERNLKVHCAVHGGNDLVKLNLDLRRERTGDLPTEPWTADFQKSKFFLFEENGQRVLVGAMKVNSINNCYSRYGVSLFSSNIRVGLGSGKINGGIASTLKSDESDRFFLFNNGLTMTCKSLDVSQLSNSSKATIEGPQVVNGAQTVVSIHNALTKRNNPSNAWVLVRIIETGEKYRSDLTTAITKFQNTQNSIKDWDFRSNDPIQEWLHAEGFPKINKLAVLKKSGTEFYYEYKRGSANSSASRRKKGQTILSLDKVGHLRYCALVGPVEVFTKPKAFWSLETDNKDDNLLYWTAFGRNMEEIAQFSEEELCELAWALMVNQKLINLSTDYRKKALSSNDEDIKTNSLLIGNNLRYLSRWVMALAAYGFKKQTLHSHKDVMSDNDLFDKIYESFVTPAMDITIELLDKRVQLLEARPNVNLSKSTKDWKDAQNSLVRRLLTNRTIAE
jgi:hypothetical protein